MNQKRYQVFISSTYEDLKEERKAVEQTIIRAGDFPVGMEAFPAADEEQFDFIKTVIAQCDFYILIIAGRYGSLAADGKSYTEKEYDYAVEIGVPVLLMLREDRGDLPDRMTEQKPKLREKLEAFISTASTRRLRKGWKTVDGLKLAVREALDHAKATKDRPGWIRGNQTASQDTLERLVALQEENARLTQELNDKKPVVSAPENLAGLETAITLTGTYKYIKAGDFKPKRYSFGLTTNLGEAFELIAPHLLSPKPDDAVNSLISSLVWRRQKSIDPKYDTFTTTDEVFQTIKIQLTALGLVNVKSSRTTTGGTALFWSLTENGNAEMINRRAIRADQNPQD